jgi:predicted transcriptional regulator
MTKSPITDTHFVELYNNADNAVDVAKALGISPQAVSKRAQLLRAKGYDVKVFPRGGKRKGAGQKGHGYIRTAVQVSFLSEWERDEYMKLSPYQRAAFALAWAQE